MIDSSLHPEQPDLLKPVSQVEPMIDCSSTYMEPSGRRLSAAPPETWAMDSMKPITFFMAGTSSISLTLPQETKAVICGVASARPCDAPSVPDASSAMTTVLMPSASHLLTFRQRSLSGLP